MPEKTSSGSKALALAQVSLIYLFTVGSLIILYAIHYSKYLDFKVFISALVVSQFIGIMLMAHYLYGIKHGMDNMQKRINEATKNDDKSDTDKTQTKCCDNMHLIIATMVLIQFISVVGDSILSILYLNTNKLTTNLFIFGILSCFAISFCIPIGYEYLAIKKDDLYEKLIDTKAESLSSSPAKMIIA